MEIVGYQLVDSNSTVVQSWGGLLGQCPGMPNPIVLPNGNQVCGMIVGQESGGYTLRAWMMERVLADEQVRLKIEIDRAAEASRLKYITEGAGQSLEYREAADEAARYVATNGAGVYPMLQASVDAGEAADLPAAAALVAIRENAWATIGAEIRRLRLTAKRAVDAATTVEQAQAAASVTWP